MLKFVDRIGFDVEQKASLNAQKPHLPLDEIRSNMFRKTEIIGDSMPTSSDIVWSEELLAVQQPRSLIPQSIHCIHVLLRGD